MMGRGDKSQTKLSFDQRRSKSQDAVHTKNGASQEGEGADGDADIKSMLLAMDKGLQNSMAALGSKIDALTYRMDRMAERIDKHAERLDMSERRLTEVEEAHMELNTGHQKIESLMKALQDKTEDLEAWSRRCNLRITGLPETTQTGNMERFVEKLLITLLGEETFSPLFVIERAHRSLGPRPKPGAPPSPIIAKVLNYRDRDAALRQARDKKTLQYEGSEISLYPDYTARVQEARKHFAPYKKQLRDLGLDYAMLYPAKLRVNSNSTLTCLRTHTPCSRL